MTLQNAVREAHARSETNHSHHQCIICRICRIIEGALSLYSLRGRFHSTFSRGADPYGFKCESEEERWDLIDLHACSPADLGYSSVGNLCLDPIVWPELFDVENPKALPMMFGIHFQ